VIEDGPHLPIQHDHRLRRFVLDAEPFGDGAGEVAVRQQVQEGERGAIWKPRRIGSVLFQSTRAARSDRRVFEKDERRPGRGQDVIQICESREIAHVVQA